MNSMGSCGLLSHTAAKASGKLLPRDFARYLLSSDRNESDVELSSKKENVQSYKGYAKWSSHSEHYTKPCA